MPYINGFQRRETKQLRAEVDELKVLAKEQYDALQALAQEVDQLRGEVRRAHEALDAAANAAAPAGGQPADGL